MKARNVLAGMLLAAAAFATAGCSGLFDSKDGGDTQTEGKFVVSLGLKSPSARFIRAFDYDLGKITAWSLTLTETGGYAISLSTSDSDGSGSSASYDSGNGKITASRIPEGTYSVEIEGSYTDDSKTYTFYGSTSGVSISSSSTGSASVLVGPKSTENGTGSLSLAFIDAASGSDATISTLASNLKITLASISDGGASYVYDATAASSANTLSFEASTGILTGSGIKSGWYRISFSGNDSYRVYLPENPDGFVEIVDNTETSKTGIEIAAESGKVYYADLSSSYNGLASNSKIKLDTLLKNLTEKMPEEGNIYIHFYSQLCFSDTDLLNSFKEKVSENKKKVIFYNGDGNEALLIGDGEGGTKTTLKDSISLNSTAAETTTFKINALELNSTATIFLTNVAIDASDVVSYSGNDTITFFLAISNGETIYTSTPFITAGTDLSSCIGFDSTSYGSDYVKSADYTVVSTSSTTADGKTVYNHYVKAVGNADITAESFAEKVSVSAAYSGGSSTYKTGDVIPYTDGTLTFSLSGLDDETATYAWYLNGTGMDSATAAASFTPYTESNLNIDGDNTVSCYVTLSGSTYIAEMKFTFTASRSALVWFDSLKFIDSDEHYAFKQLANELSSGTTTTLFTESSNTTSKVYCFDKSSNFWTAELSNSALVITRYSPVVSTGLLSTTGTSETNANVTAAPIDMTYDIATGYFYVLAGNSNSGYTLHRILPFGTDSANVYAGGSLSVSTATGSTFTPSQIAVYNGTLYIGADSATIYKAQLTASGTTLTAETPSTWAVLYDALEREELASCAITDMQIGDGLGNETGSLFVLARQNTDYISIQGASESNAADTDNLVYSRGALIKVAIADSDPSAYEYGWAENSTIIQTNDGYYGTLYSPSSSSSDKFYGPTHFAAVVPKKLVILDDGISYISKGNLSNEDSFKEFDISTSSITSGASVSATEPSYSSGFTWY